MYLSGTRRNLREVFSIAFTLVLVTVKTLIYIDYNLEHPSGAMLVTTLSKRVSARAYFA